MHKYFITAAALILLLMACGKNKAQSNSAGDATQGTVLAKVNGKTLTLEDLRYQFPPEYRDQLKGQDLRDAVETWINTEILAQRGKEMGLDKDPAVLAVMKYRENDAIARRLIELEITGKTAVSQSEIDSVYAAQKDNYKSNKERFRASHILVATKDEADAVYGRLKKGDDFAKLAQDYSKDRQSVSQGGDLGYFEEDQIDPEFGSAAKKLKIGEFSAPVKTQYGYHIIKLTDRQAAGAPLDSMEVKGKLSESLLTTKQGGAFGTLMDSLKKTAKIERLSPAGLNLPAVQDSV
jgi:parvulin-like peptidyl-prolyl isomerase